MQPADKPTQLEKDLSYIISVFLPPLGILIAVVYYVKYPPGLRRLARNCLLISTASMVICTIVVIVGNTLFD